MCEEYWVCRDPEEYRVCGDMEKYWVCGDMEKYRVCRDMEKHRVCRDPEDADPNPNLAPLALHPGTSGAGVQPAGRDLSLQTLMPAPWLPTRRTVATSCRPC